MTAIATHADRIEEVEIRAPDGAIRTAPVRGSRMLIGRRPGAEICIDHDTISRQHAELIRDPFGRWWIRDLGSRNGTKVNGVAVPEQVVKAGDVIRVGKWDIRMRTVPQRSPTLAMPRTHVDDQLHARVLEEGTAAPPIMAEHLELLLDFSQRLARTTDPQARRRMLCELLVEDSFHGLAAVMVRCPAGSEEPQVLCGPVQNPLNPKPFYVSRTLLTAMRNSGKPVLGSNTSAIGSSLELSIDSSMIAVGGIACPLAGQEEGDGLYIAVPPQYATPEWLALAALAGRHWVNAELFWRERHLSDFQNAIEQELKQAQRLQQQFMPRAAPIAGLDWCVRWEPCRWMAGDYANVMALPDGKRFAAVADVCGKGLHASLVAAGLHTLVRTALMVGASLSDLMNRANEHLRQFLPEDSFVTMTAVTLDPATGSGQYVNAGHPSPYLIEGHGKITALEGALNLPLGLEVDSFTAVDFQLGKNQMLLMYSDGCTDLLNPEGQQMGRVRLEEMIRQIATPAKIRSATEFVTRLFDQMEHHRGICLPPDDRTVLTCAIA